MVTWKQKKKSSKEIKINKQTKNLEKSQIFVKKQKLGYQPN